MEFRSEMLFHETMPKATNMSEDNKSIKKSYIYKKSASDEDSDFES